MKNKTKRSAEEVTRTRKQAKFEKVGIDGVTLSRCANLNRSHCRAV